MRKVITAIALAAMTVQMAVPAMAASSFNPANPFDPSTALGWQRTNNAAAVAYFRMPVGDAPSFAPRLGIMVSAPVSYGLSSRSAGSSLDPLGFNVPRLLDVSLTGRDLSAPWRSDSWLAALSVGNTVAWASNPDALPPGQRAQMFDNGVSWVAVGVITVGIGIGIIALTDRKE